MVAQHEVTRHPVEDRLDNWARWASGRSGPRGADCITGTICESLRRAALGNVWSGNEVREDVNNADALAVERAMRLLPMPQLLMLVWHYVRRAPSHVICRKLGIPHRPSDVFRQRLEFAQDSMWNLLT